MECPQHNPYRNMFPEMLHATFRGLRPARAGRLRTSNLPNPAIATVSSRASAPAMAENTAPTRRSAAAKR